MSLFLGIVAWGLNAFAPSPLSMAVERRDVKAVRKLLASGVSPDQPLSDGLAPLELACGYRRAEAYVLVKSGRLTAKALTALTTLRVFQTAIAQFQIDTGVYPQGLNALFRSPQTTPGWKGPYIAGQEPKDPWGKSYSYMPDWLGDPARQWLATSEAPSAVGPAETAASIEIVRMLLDSKADPGRSYGAVTPLTTAILSGYSQTVRLLLKREPGLLKAPSKKKLLDPNAALVLAGRRELAEEFKREFLSPATLGSAPMRFARRQAQEPKSNAENWSCTRRFALQRSR